MLWHGTSLKGVMYRSKKSKPKKPMKIDLLPVNSKMDKYLFSYLFNIPSDLNVVQVMGTPRMDIMRKKTLGNVAEDKKRFLAEINETALSVEKIVLYAPTHRENDTTRFFPFRYNKEDLNKILEDNKAIILLRTHVNDSKAEIFDYSKHRRIIYWDQNKYPDLYNYLHLMDVVITDYSSLYSECLYLHIPMIFVPYDEFEFGCKWGFLYPYQHITAGIKVTEQRSFLLSLSIHLKSREQHSTLPHTFKHIFHEVFDGKSCERITEWIKNE